MSEPKLDLSDLEVERLEMPVAAGHGGLESFRMGHGGTELGQSCSMACGTDMCACMDMFDSASCNEAECDCTADW